MAMRTMVLCLSLVAVPSSAQTFVLNKTFTLNVGDTRQLVESQFSIVFIGVEYDGRCPTGVTCVWQGDAAAQFEIHADNVSQVVTLHTAGGEHLPSMVEAFGRTISLVSLGPYPRKDVKTRVDSYVAMLSVS